MDSSETTCWDLIRDAAAGKPQERESFARRYEPIVRAYLAARWRSNSYKNEIDDACQEVFAECFRTGGPLERVDSTYPKGFRAFLFGIIRNVAMRYEQRRKRIPQQQDSGLDQIHNDESSLSKVLDRAWAVAMTQQAAARQADLAKESGPDAIQRYDLLRLRFHEELPIREIAKRWKVDPAVLHREYAKARHEFKKALRDVVGEHSPGATPSQIDSECRNLLLLLGR